MPALRAILFDLWGTLIIDDPESSERRRIMRRDATRDALAELGFAHAHDDIEAAFLAAGAEHERLHQADRDLSTRGRTLLYLQHVDPALLDRVDEDGWRRLDDVILTPALTHRPVIMPGAREALAELKGLGIPTGLISNAGITPGFVLRQILDDFGLLRLLDITVFSDEVEMCKPAPAIFAGALAELGVDAPDAAFVGAQPRLDVFGARQAGMWSVQIGDLSADGMTPHARIAALAELVPALRSLGLIG